MGIEFEISRLKSSGYLFCKNVNILNTTAIHILEKGRSVRGTEGVLSV